jgi:hypothetical protein
MQCFFIPPGDRGGNLARGGRAATTEATTQSQDQVKEQPPFICNIIFFSSLYIFYNCN